LPLEPHQKPSPRPHSKTFLHPVSLGLLGGLLSILIIGLVIPFLPAKVVSPVTQKTSSTSVSPTTAQPVSVNPAAKPALPSDRVTINRIGTNAPVIAVGLTSSGAMGTPKTLWQVGRYDKGAVVGASGTAVLVGHSGAPGQVGVFEHIDRIKVGDIVTYTRIDGTTISFRAISTEAYPVNDQTAQFLVAPTAKSSLNLISCYGKWDASTQEYDQRWIVKTVRID
jgi:LPXTG-site transpeptidase (sortase) family protein